MRLYPLLLPLIAFPLAQSSANAAVDRIQWRANVQAAALEARDTHKPLLIKFSTSWCGYCRKMQRVTFANADVIHHVEDCFVPVSVDGDASRELAQQMGIRSYPTTVIISPEMKVLAMITGFRTPDQLSVDLTKICAHDHNDEANPHSRILTESVFGQTCPVSLVRDATLSPGDPRIFTTYRGFRVTFMTDAHRHEFLSQPERYWPVADGRCVVSALDSGEARFGVLDNGLTYRGRIWLFANQPHRERFRQAPHEYLARLVQRLDAAGPRKPDADRPATAQLSKPVPPSHDAH